MILKTIVKEAISNRKNEEKWLPKSAIKLRFIKIDLYLNRNKTQQRQLF